MSFKTIVNNSRTWWAHASAHGAYRIRLAFHARPLASAAVLVTAGLLVGVAGRSAAGMAQVSLLQASAEREHIVHTHASVTRRQPCRVRALRGNAAARWAARAGAWLRGAARVDPPDAHHRHRRARRRDRQSGDDSGEADYELRWFTPTVEVPLCGHATVAACHVLAEERRLGMTAPTRGAPGDRGPVAARPAQLHARCRPAAARARDQRAVWPLRFWHDLLLALPGRAGGG